MVRAIWNGEVVAESDDTRVVEGNHYFPRESVVDGRLMPSSHRTVCGWKGTASYFDVVAGGEVNRNAAWTYEEPLPAAAEITGHVAFWRGVDVVGDER